MTNLSVIFLAAMLCVEASGGTAPAPGWQYEADMIDIAYTGRVPEGGELKVKDWRNDGGMMAAENRLAIASYSKQDRIAISLEKLRGNEADGAASWTILSFMSFSADRTKAGFHYDCGIGKNFMQHITDNTKVVAVVPYDNKTTPGEEPFTNGILAAAELDLVTGSITPISPADVYCVNMLGD
jgi:hypothetical protein